MTCIKTGARVRFVEYGIVHAADLHRIGDTIVVNCNYSKDGFYTSHSDLPTHEVLVGHGYMNKTKGVFVVPAKHVTEARPSVVMSKDFHDAR